MSVQTQLDRLATAKSAIKSAIEAKGVTVEDDTKLDGYASLILQISGGGDFSIFYDEATQTLFINTDEEIMHTDGSTLYINTARELVLQDITVTPTKSQQTFEKDEGYDAIGTVTVEAIPEEYIIPTGSETKTSNGTYDVTNLAQLVVNVSGGGGGLPSGITALDFGEITVSTAFTTTRQTFTHKLGVTPDLMIVWRSANIATTYSMLAAIRGNQFGWRSSAYNNHMAYHGNSTTNVTWTNSNSTTYGISNMTATNFQLASSSSSYYWRAGTYNYLAIKF